MHLGAFGCPCRVNSRKPSSANADRKGRLLNDGWCPWPGSNQHSLRNSILSRARLPIPPQGLCRGRYHGTGMVVNVGPDRDAFVLWPPAVAPLTDGNGAQADPLATESRLCSKVADLPCSALGSPSR